MLESLARPSIRMLLFPPLQVVRVVVWVILLVVILSVDSEVVAWLDAVMKSPRLIFLRTRLLATALLVTEHSPSDIFESV